MQENHCLLLFIALLLTLGVLHTKGEEGSVIDDNKWIQILVYSSTSLIIYYTIMLCCCMTQLTSRYEFTFVFKVLILVIITGLLHALVGYSLLYQCATICSVCCSILWLLLQGIHYLDNVQILQNWLILEILSVKRSGSDAEAIPFEEFNHTSLETTIQRKKAREVRSQAFLFLHLFVGMAACGAVLYLWHWLDGLMKFAGEHHVGCITSSSINSSSSSSGSGSGGSDNGWVRHMHDTNFIVGVVMILLSLPRFTNKGLQLPVLLLLYQCNVLMTIVVLKMDGCDNSAALALTLEPTGHTSSDSSNTGTHISNTLYRYSIALHCLVTVLSFVFALCIILYNLQAPNLISLSNIRSGSLWDRRINKMSEVVRSSNLRDVEDNDRERDRDRAGEASRLLKGQGQQDGYGTTTAAAGAGAGAADIPYSMTDRDRNSTPVPAYFVYFLLLSAYLPMLLSQWNMMLQHGPPTPTLITLDDGTQLAVIPASSTRAEGGVLGQLFYGNVGTGGSGSGITASPQVDLLCYGLFAISLLLWAFYGTCLLVTYWHRDSI